MPHRIGTLTGGRLAARRILGLRMEVVDARAALRVHAPVGNKGAQSRLVPTKTDKRQAFLAAHLLLGALSGEDNLPVLEPSTHWLGIFEFQAEAEEETLPTLMLNHHPHELQSIPMLTSLERVARDVYRLRSITVCYNPGKLREIPFSAQL